METTCAEQGSKDTEGKPDLSLIDPLFITELGKVMSFGAKKYAPNNWRKGIAISKSVAAAMRHLNEFNDGVDLDKETGLSHLAHAAANLMFALRNLQNHPQLDDRHHQLIGACSRRDVVAGE